MNLLWHENPSWEKEKFVFFGKIFEGSPERGYEDVSSKNPIEIIRGGEKKSDAGPKIIETQRDDHLTTLARTKNYALWDDEKKQYIINLQNTTDEPPNLHNLFRYPKLELTIPNEGHPDGQSVGTHEVIFKSGRYYYRDGQKQVNITTGDRIRIIEPTVLKAGRSTEMASPQYFKPAKTLSGGPQESKRIVEAKQEKFRELRSEVDQKVAKQTENRSRYLEKREGIENNIYIVNDATPSLGQLFNQPSLEVQITAWNRFTPPSRKIKGQVYTTHTVYRGENGEYYYNDEDAYKRGVVKEKPENRVKIDVGDKITISKD